MYWFDGRKPKPDSQGRVPMSAGGGSTPWYKTPWGAAGIGGGLAALLGLLSGRDAFGSPGEYTQRSGPAYRIGQDPYATAIYNQLLETLASPRTLRYGDFAVPYYDKTKLSTLLSLLGGMLSARESSGVQRGGDSGWLSDALGAAASIYGVASQASALEGIKNALTGGAAAAGGGGAAAGLGGGATGAAGVGAGASGSATASLGGGADAATTAATTAALGPAALMGVAAAPIVFGNLFGDTLNSLFGWGGQLTPEEIRSAVSTLEGAYAGAPTDAAKQGALTQLAWWLMPNKADIAGLNVEDYTNKYSGLQDAIDALNAWIAANPNQQWRNWFNPLTGKVGPVDPGVLTG